MLAAARDLVLVLREHDLEGDALRAGRVAERLLRAWVARRRVGDVDALDRAVGRVQHECDVVPVLRYALPVRRACEGLALAVDTVADDRRG